MCTATAPRIHKHAHRLHPAQERCVHEMVRLLPPRREHEQHVALCRKTLDAHALERRELVLALQRRVERCIGRGAGAARVDAARDAKGDEAREGRLRDAAKAEEADGARGGGGGRAQLRAAERERRPVEFGPLYTM